MNKLLEVREFDTIIGNENYKDDEKYKYFEAFDSLLDFIREFDCNDESSDALKFTSIGYKRNIGNVVNIKNYVSLIQMKNGYRIQVLPKIDFGKTDDGNTQTKKVFLKMLQSMKDFPSKVFNDADMNVDKMNLYDIFINMYLQEVRRLVKRGIRSNYVQQEDNQGYFKGKLLVKRHIKANLSHKERFYVLFDEFHPNGPENRLVKATLEKLQKLTGSTKNSKDIKQLLTHFEAVDSSTNYEKDFSKVVINRNTESYKILIKWAKVFLTNKSFATFTGSMNSRALLFPMESVYESYVAKQMKKVFCPDGWDVHTQDRGHYLFMEPKKQFALIPDIVIRKDNKTVILDTKWKRLYKTGRKNYGISPEDMYQMYAYSKKYETSEVWLLYPLNEDMKNHAPIEFYSGDNTYVRLFFVDVANIEDSLKELKQRIIV